MKKSYSPILIGGHRGVGIDPTRDPINSFKEHPIDEKSLYHTFPNTS
jgi:hypothetical protein